MNQKTKIFVEKESCRRLWDLLCVYNENIRCLPLFWVVWLEKVALPPQNFLAVGCWAGVLGWARLRRESVGHEAETGVVKGSVER